jgi:hypothetical protein
LWGPSCKIRIGSQGKRVMTQTYYSKIACKLCKQFSHLEKDCWRKARNFLAYGDPRYQLNECPKRDWRRGTIISKGTIVLCASMTMKAIKGQASLYGMRKSKPQVKAQVIALDRNKGEVGATIVKGHSNTFS